MVKITVGIDGMMCGMCEAHINDAIRNNFKVTKVSASHKTNSAEIISETDIPEEKKSLNRQATSLLLTILNRMRRKKVSCFSNK